MFSHHGQKRILRKGILPQYCSDTKDDWRLTCLNGCNVQLVASVSKKRGEDKSNGQCLSFCLIRKLHLKKKKTRRRYQENKAKVNASITAMEER